MRTASPYRSLEPETWRFLMALGVIFLALSAKLSRLSDLARQTNSVASILGRLSLAAQEISCEDDDDAGIVRKVVLAWDAEIGDALARCSLEPEARQLLTALRGLLGGTVAGDPYRLLFDRIEARAHGIYGDAWRPAVLSVAHLASHPRGPDVDRHRDPYPVSALTPWPPGDSEAEIELLVCCDQFGPEAFAAVPMLLAHECVCHVPARQDRAKNDSPFAEGFVDWAAHHFLYQWAVDLGPELAAAARQHAEGLKRVLTDRVGREGAARRRGHEAAEVLSAWLESDCGLPHLECRPRVARLAVELNQIDQPIARKDDFVTKLDQPYPPDVAEALRAWVRGDLETEGLFGATTGSHVSMGDRAGP